MTTTISNNHITATINPIGAELMQLCKNSKNYIWEVDTTFWNKTSPILFPIVGRLKNDLYFLEGEKYTMMRHGFAREKEFLITEKGENWVTFTLENTLMDSKIYPYDFRLALKYTLHDATLHLEYEVTNLSEKEMPFSIGAHPAFAIDFTQNKYTIHFDQDDCLLTHELESEQFSGKSKNISLTNNTLALDYSLFEKDALVFKELSSRNLTITENDKPFLKIGMGNFPHLGIWTKNKAPFLCIEPWFGYADNQTTNGNIMEKEGIQILAANQKFTCNFTIEIL